MTISELIERLEALKAEHGPDILVRAENDVPEEVMCEYFRADSVDPELIWIW